MSPSLHSFEHNNLKVLSEDSERIFGRTVRLGSDGGRNAVLVVQPSKKTPSRSTLDRLSHEYELKDELDEAWSAKPLELVLERDRTMLVLEDKGDAPLDGLLAGSLRLAGC
jgi:hypothetical protein